MPSSSQPAGGSVEMTPEAYSAGEMWKPAARSPQAALISGLLRESWGESHLAHWAGPLSSQPPDGECGQCGSLAHPPSRPPPASPATQNPTLLLARETQEWNLPGQGKKPVSFLHPASPPRSRRLLCRHSSQTSRLDFRVESKTLLQLGSEALKCKKCFCCIYMPLGNIFSLQLN